MIHQPSGGASGKAADLAIRAEEILKTRTRLTEIYAEHCRVPKAGGQADELESKAECMRRYELALERDFFLDPEEALRFGLIDKVVQCVPSTASR
jgi:ATP-dependent Clp protease protease subunit